MNSTFEHLASTHGTTACVRVIANIARLTAVIAAPGFAQMPLGTDWTYQGVLQDGRVAVTGPVDMIFTLYDTEIVELETRLARIEAMLSDTNGGTR